MNTIRLRMHGRVHGVGFRFYVSQQADKYDIRGYVKNLPNGTVEIVGQSASPQKLAMFGRECRRGPLLSKIEKVEEEELPDAKEFDDFDIL